MTDTPPTQVLVPVTTTTTTTPTAPRKQLPPVTLGLLITAVVNVCVLVAVTVLMVVGRVETSPGMGIIGGILATTGLANGLHGWFINGSDPT